MLEFGTRTFPSAGFGMPAPEIWESLILNSFATSVWTVGKFSLLYNLVANFLGHWGILFAFQSCPLALYIQKNLSLLCHPVFQSLLGSFSVLGEVLEPCLQPSSYSLKVHCSFRGFLLHLLLCFVTLVATSTYSGKTLVEVLASGLDSFLIGSPSGFQSLMLAQVWPWQHSRKVRLVSPYLRMLPIPFSLIVPLGMKATMLSFLWRRAFYTLEFSSFRLLCILRSYNFFKLWNCM